MQLSNQKYVDPNALQEAIKAAKISLDDDFTCFTLKFLSQISIGISKAAVATSQNVYRDFIGSLYKKVKYTDSTGAPIVAKNKEDFPTIKLDIDGKNLMAAWDRAFFSNAPNSNSGSLVTESSITRIDEIPKVLIFSLNRFSEGAKRHNQFMFPAEMYIDRFL